MVLLLPELVLVLPLWICVGRWLRDANTDRRGPDTVAFAIAGPPTLSLLVLVLIFTPAAPTVRPGVCVGRIVDGGRVRHTTHDRGLSRLVDGVVGHPNPALASYTAVGVAMLLVWLGDRSYSCSRLLAADVGWVVDLVLDNE